MENKIYKVYKLDTRSTITLVQECFSGSIIRMYNLRDDGLLFITDVNIYAPSFCETIIRAPEDDDFDVYYYQYKTLLEDIKTSV